MTGAAVLLIGSYVLGSIPFGLLIGRFIGSVDVRQHGSGNIGTSNVMRTVGRGAAVVVLLLDAGKGVVPLWAAHHFGMSAPVIAAAAVLVVAGHIWPVFLRFNGGKGIATALGTAVALDWRIAVLLVAVWLCVLLVTRYISVSSIAAATAFPVLAWILEQPGVVILGAALISAFAVYRHRSNITRLLSGREYRFSERVVQGADRR